MSLVPSKQPVHFEGEIQCSIDWLDRANDRDADTRSMAATTTMANLNGESLFIRIRKRSKIVSNFNTRYRLTSTFLCY